MPKTINTFDKGLNLSIDPVNQARNTYSYALNAVKEDIVGNTSVISNEKGFTTYIDLGYKYILLGTRYLSKKDYVLFIKAIDGETEFNKIILIENGVYKKTVSDRLDWNFNSSHPIISTYRLNYKNQRIIYFVDGFNDDRVINIDIDSNSYDISLFSINSSANKPIIDATVVDNGGSVISGQYFIAVSYNLGDSYTTEPLIVSNGISIASEDYYNNKPVTETLTKLYGQTDGDIIPTATRKSLSINVTNIDDSFDSYNIIIYRQTLTGNVTRLISNIDPTESNFIFTGFEGELNDTISLNDIITDSINYYASEAIQQKDNRLLRANSKLRATNINYQEYANNIKVNYIINEELVSDLNNINGYKTSGESDGGFYDALTNTPSKCSISPSYLSNTANNDTNNTTFMRDEVYSLGVGFELIDGTDTEVFHIPGRALNTFYTTPTGVGEYGRAFTSIWDNDTVESQPRWKVRNTAVKQPLGKLAYWRSSESYKDGYGFPVDGEKTGSGKSYIRHHKMPSDVLEPIFRTEIVGNPNKDKGEITSTKIYKRNLGLDFSNIIIPVELQNLIKKIKFFYTPRDSTNKSILSKGITYNTTDENPKRQSSLFNYNLTPSTEATTLEFISPETNFQFKQANLSGAKLKVIGIDKGYVNMLGEKEKIDGAGPYYIRHFNNQLFEDTGRKQAIISGFAFYNQRAIPKEELYSRDINKLIYVDDNFKGTTEGFNLDFSGSKNTSILQLITPLRLKPSGVATPLYSYYPELKYATGSDVSSNLYDTFNVEYPIALDNGNVWNGYGDAVNDIEVVSWANKLYWDTVYYVQITSNKTNLYGNINNLKYVQLSKTIPYTTGDVNITAQINGGDTFIDVHHTRKNKSILVSRTGDRGQNVPITINTQGDFNNRYAGQTDNLITEVLEVGTQSFISFICETDINIRMRREGNNDDEKYFPKSYFGLTNIRNVDGRFTKKEFYKIEDPYNNKFIKPYFAAYKTIDELVNNLSDDIRYYTRIVYSDVQSLEDKTDNYRKTRANNYRDLPLDKGGISILFIKNEKLYAITRDTVFNVYTSNQSLQSLGETNITVGTGQFLGVEPIDLISIDGGYAGTTSKLSFVESIHGYLFVDKYKGKIILFNDKLNEISLKDINDFFRDNFSLIINENISDFDNPLNNNGYTCGYDSELNRFLITKLQYDGQVNKSFTLSYYPQTDQWCSYHSYLPNNYINHPNSLLVKNNNSQLMKVNTGEYGKYFDNSIKPFIIETVFNEYPTQTKTFDNITVNLKSQLENKDTNKFFDKLLLYTEYQCSGEIVLDTTNLTKKERDWMVNKFQDLCNNNNEDIFTKEWIDISSQYPIDKIVNNDRIDNQKPWYLRGRLRDKFLKVRFIENNLQNNKLICNFVSSIYRPSQR